MGHHQKKPQGPKQTTKEKLRAIKKERKQKLKQKRARLIIRNLPFNADQDNLKAHFEKYGEIEEVTVLKKEDGKLVGCGFVQFKLVQKAAKARFHLNNKPFLGREIQVDFAQAKNKFKNDNVTSEIKEEEVEIKEEPIDEDETNNVSTTEIKSEDEKNVEESDNDEENEIEESEDEVDEEEEEKPVTKKTRFESNDIVEGRTVFVKNVPFSATNEDLKECMKQFGPIFYALICIDKFTEHSKGSAFVKFCNAEDAEKALSAGTELTLLGNILDCHKALGRNELQQKSNATKGDKTIQKDSRNLYLVKEGVILAGSKAAEGVSASDMAKRLQLEQYKTQMLRNLNMFVSRDRIVIHNLPISWDDKKLRALILNNSPKNVSLKEVKIMRDMKNVDPSGVGKSKEFGFVAFTKHDDALFVLRKLNNNPKIFSEHRRPIVAFSIENRAMIKAKQKRLEKSKMKNPKCKDFDPNVVKKDEEKKNANERVTEEPEYAGVSAKPGVQKMRSRYNLKTQARLHHENIKREKKKNKFAKKTLSERKKDFTKQPKQKINNKRETDNFAKMVANYKQKISTVPGEKKTKWYNT